MESSSSSPAAEGAGQGSEPAPFPWKPLLAIAAGACLLRALWVGSLDDPYGGALVRDAGAYDAWAQAIVDGTAPRRPYFADPLYAWLLAGCRLLAGGGGRGPVMALHVLLDGCEPLVVGALAWRAFGGRAEALLAALLAAIYEPLIVHAGFPDKTVLSTILVALAALALLELTRRAGRGAAFLMGAVIGVSCLGRPNALLYLPVGALLLWRGLGLPAGTPRGPRAWRAAALLAGGLLPILPVAARNVAVGGELVLLTANFGHNFYLGNHPGSARSGLFSSPPEIASDPLHEEEEWTSEAERRVGHPLTTREREVFWLGEGLRYCAAAPLDACIRTAHKALLLVHAFEVPDNMSLLLLRAGEPWPLRGPFPLLGWGLLGPLALWGAIRSGARPGPQRVLLAAAAIYGASLLPFTVCARYRLPLPVCLLPYAAWALLRLRERVQAARGGGRADGQRLATELALLALLALLVHLPAVDAAPYEARDRYDVAVTRNHQGRYAEALDLARGATALDPGLQQAHLEAGIALVHLARADEARAEYLSATRGRDDVASLAWVNLGALELRLGRKPQAVRALERALPLLEWNPDARARAQALLSQAKRP